jgi:hypothetical protein
MARGEAWRTPVSNVEQLGALIGGLNSSQAIALGTLRHGLPERVGIVTKRAINGSGASVDACVRSIARSTEHIVYRPGCRGFVLIDYDVKGMPAAVAEHLKRSGDLWLALWGIIPALERVARVTRASTSAGLYRTDTRTAIPGSTGQHIYLSVEDVADSRRFLTTLHERCWLHGLGWLMVGAGGQLLERSIIDRMVGSPERLIFEGPPILINPLAQSVKARQPKIEEGEWLDTRAACPPLTVAEQAGLAELRAKARSELAGEAAKAREEFIEREAEELARRTGTATRAAREIIRKRCEGVLLPSVVLPFDDPELAGKTVADVLADPATFEGETLADPLEGIDYGRCKAKIMRRADGSVWIHSFAHGRTTYDLQLDAEAIRAAMSAAEKGDVITVFTEMLLRADIDQVEEEALIAFAHERSGVGVRTIQRHLKKMRAKRESEQCQAERERRLAERDDPRPQLLAPGPDAPFIPQMEAYNSVLSRSKDKIPPARNLEGHIVCIQTREVAGTHAFVSANEDTDATQKPPPQWVIHAMSLDNTAEMLERHIDFVDQRGQSVHCPSLFVRHYVTRDDSALPPLVAVATLPLITGDGQMIYAEGLDRDRGIAFNVDPGLIGLIPVRKDCDRRTVGAALRYLIDEWLCDIATDLAGKCTLVTLALSLIERTLLEERPVYFLTAGRRGSGKTTALKMVLEAATGNAVSAAAWSPNEEERRKALMGYLVSGVPYILWDNIARGAQISCPHIERSCTAARIEDRRLGATEMVRAAATTVHCFTGNNINPKGDLASRAFQVRLDVDRTDPENREFRHPDPLGWTRAHRNEILRALYVILLGNATLSLPRSAPMKTRFKLWYRLVGSAVEFAAECAGWQDPRQTAPFKLDFEKLCLDQEAEDEESTSLGEALEALEELAGKRGAKTFTATHLAEAINTEMPDMAAVLVRSFLFPEVTGERRHLSTKVGQRLKKYDRMPVRHGRRTIRLVTVMDKHDKTNVYKVETTQIHEL